MQKYRIDYYILKYNIAIEIDEDGHKYRNKTYEKNREIELKEKLGCTFIRFNPDDKSTNIGKLFGEIHKQIIKNK